jgi:hypothetical protein
MSLALAVLLCLAPQGDPVLAGRVVDAAGKPVAEATVTLLARPIPRHLDPAREHRVVVATDAHGAFHATLRADGVYSVWAASATAATAIAEGETGPGFVQLQLAPCTGPRSIPIAGLDAWSEAATFHYRALVGGEDLDFAPVALRDGALALPPLPPLEQRVIEILTSDGRVLWACDAEADNRSLILPAPGTWTVRVTDDKSAPLQGVEVLVHLRNYWATESDAVPYGDRFHPLWPSQGRTDADGKLTLRCPSGSSSFWLLSRKDGFAAAIDGCNGRQWIHAGKLVPIDPETPTDHFDVTLRPAPPVVLPLATANGSALAVDTLFVTARVSAMDANGGGFGQPVAFALPIADGRATMPALPERTELEAAATTLAPGVRAQMRERFGFAPAAVRLSQPKALRSGVPFDLQNWRALVVITADGRPAANTPVFLGMAKSQGTIRRTDRRGRLLFEASDPLRVTVYSRAGIGTAVAEGNETRLELRAAQPTKGRVVDDEGKPVVGARVKLEMQVGGDVTGEYLALAWLLPRVCSDAEGHFEVLLPPFPASIKLTTAWTANAPQISFDWDPAKPADIVITAPRQ